jgi:hypothetical protein
MKHGQQICLSVSKQFPKESGQSHITSFMINHQNFHLNNEANGILQTLAGKNMGARKHNF